MVAFLAGGESLQFVLAIGSRSTAILRARGVEHVSLAEHFGFKLHAFAALRF